MTTPKFQLRLDEAQKALWIAAQKAQGVSDLSEWIRRCCDHSARLVLGGEGTAARPSPPPQASSGEGQEDLPEGMEDLTLRFDTEEKHRRAKELFGNPEFEGPKLKDLIATSLPEGGAGAAASITPPSESELKIPSGGGAGRAVPILPLKPKPAPPLDKAPLATDCKNADYHWRLGAGEICEDCQGVA